MELEEFIRNTLISIHKGIHGANEEFAKEAGKKLGVDFSATFGIERLGRERSEGYITFDIAVTVSQESGKSGGGGIKIAVASLGGELSSKGMQEHISRIKFHIMPMMNIG